MELICSLNKEILFTISSLMMKEYIPKSSVTPSQTRKMNLESLKSMLELKEKEFQPKKNNNKKQLRKQRKISISILNLMIQKICNSNLSMSQLYSMLQMSKFNLLMILRFLIPLMYNFNTLTTHKKSKMQMEEHTMIPMFN